MAKSKDRILVELLLIIISFAKSFWLGILILGYILYTKDKYKRIKAQLDASLAEDIYEKPKVPTFRCTPNYIYPYKRCVVKQYGKWFVIMKPNGEILDKMFDNLEEAKNEIDLVSPFLIKPKKNENL